MPYQGYLVKVGAYTLPTKFIQTQSYKATLSVLDRDSYRDMEGVLHRTALAHRVNKIEFMTPKMLSNTDVSELFGNIRDNYNVPVERKFVGTFYVPELDEYISQDMYMTDITFPIHGILNGEIRYDEIRVAFIAY